MTTQTAEKTNQLALQFIPAKEAIARFHYLYEYNPDIYARQSIELSVEEYISYQLTLTVPKLNAPGTWVRITEPVQVFVHNGVEYLASGNSRIKTLDMMIKGGSKEEFADVPFITIPEWNNEELMRIQYATNDNTRRNDRLVKLQQISEYIKRTVAAVLEDNKQRLSKGEITELPTESKVTANVKKEAQTKFSLTATDIKNSLLIVSHKVPAIVNQYLNEGMIKTDPAIELINIFTTLKVNPATVIGDLTKQELPLSMGNIKKWRDAYVKTSTTPEAVVDNHLSNNKKPNGKGGGGGGGGGSSTTPKPPTAQGEAAEANLANADDVKVELVPLGKMKTSTNEDAITVAYIFANLLESEELGEKTNNIRQQLLQLMDQLADLQVSPEKQKAITEQFKKAKN